MPPQPTLDGPRVRLRPWRPDDAGAVHRICQDTRIQRWTQVPVPYRRADADAFAGHVATRTWSDGGALFAVTDPDDGALLGSMGLLHLTDGLGGVGYWSARRARGRGLTSEALRMLSRWALDERGATRLEAVVAPANTDSRRVAERAGYREEGTLRARAPHRGERIDVVMYSLLDTDPRP